MALADRDVKYKGYKIVAKGSGGWAVIDPKGKLVPGADDELTVTTAKQAVDAHAIIAAKRATDRQELRPVPTKAKAQDLQVKGGSVAYDPYQDAFRALPNGPTSGPYKGVKKEKWFATEKQARAYLVECDRLEFVKPDKARDTVAPIPVGRDAFGDEGALYHAARAKVLRKRLKEIESRSGSLKPDALRLAKAFRNAIDLHEMAMEAWKASDRAWKMKEPEAGDYEDGAAELSNQANSADGQATRLEHGFTNDASPAKFPRTTAKDAPLAQFQGMAV
jgi:hypothetical protein